MKIFKMAFIIFLALPYLFFATSINDVKNSNQREKCVVSKVEKDSTLFDLGTVVLRSFRWLKEDRRIIIPLFGSSGDFTYIKCGNEPEHLLLIDTDNFWGFSVGQELLVDRTTADIKFLGIPLWKEVDINGFSYTRMKK